MEQNTPKFRLRLNLFDTIVLVLALAVGAFLLWNTLKPAAPVESEVANTATVRYTIRFLKWPEGKSELIHPGDKLVDTIKNYELGTVVSAQATPALAMELNQVSRQYELVEIPTYEDILVTVESPCTITDDAITLGGGYVIRVGGTTYLRGQGYMASGPVINIEREGLK